MIASIRKFFSLFTPRERRHFVGVLITVIVMSMVQIAGVGSIIPFVSLLVDRGAVHDNALLAWAYEVFGFSDTANFLFFVGSGVLLVLVLGNAFTAFAIWLMAKFAWDNQVRLSRQLLRKYLAKPYSFFLNRNSADIGKNVLVEVTQLTQGVLIPSLNIVAFGATALFMVLFLLWLNPLLTAVASTVFGLSYGLIYLLIRRPLHRLGRRRLIVNAERFKSVNEAFGSVKEVKVLDRAAAFVSRYDSAARVFARALVAQNVLGMLPRYIIETVAFGLLMSVLLYLLYLDANLQEVIPLAGAFAFAAYRLLPTMQRIFIGVSALRFNQSVLDTLHRDLVEEPSVSPVSAPTGMQRMNLTQELRLQGVSYTYPGASWPAVSDVDIVIPVRSFVAFVGATGAGKTTLADIVLGLLTPQGGRIAIDGIELSAANLRSWQANLGYVPQEIFLSDDTVAANIAYGISADAIDLKAVKHAAEIANIDSFIREQLPKGYHTVIGERGVRLSGGQRQRIGLARALYHDPAVLVLDEATSALDGATEASVHAAILQAAAVKTVIVIAHRLATVQHCDCIYVMEEGRVVACGTYGELFEDSEEFRRIARGFRYAVNTDG